MGNICETICCGCLIPKKSLNDTEYILNSELPRYEKKNINEIFMIDLPIECNISNFDESKFIELNTTTQTIASECNKNDESLIVVTPAANNNEIKIYDFIESYLKQAFFTTIQFPICSRQFNIQNYDKIKLFQTRSEIDETTTTNVDSYFKTFFKFFTISTKIDERTTIFATTTTTRRSYYGLRPISEILLRVNHFNFF